MDAHRGDVAELRREMQVGFARVDERFARLEGRMEAIHASMAGRMDAMQAGMDGRLETVQASLERLIEKGLREQTRFFFLAWSVLLAAFIGIYAR